MIPASSIVLTFLLYFSVNCDHVFPQNRLESQFLLLLKNWRLGYVDSDIIPLPSLKSLAVPYVQHSYDRKGIKMTYVLRRMELTGLDSFSIEELIVLETKKTLETSISIHIPKLSLYADNYELKGRAYLIYPLKGSGNMTVIFRDNTMNFKLRFAEDGNNTKIKDFLFDFSIAKIEANLVDSSWPINQVLNSDGVEILASYHEDIVQAMWHYIVPYVNRHLLNVSTAQIVDIILNTSL